MQKANVSAGHLTVRILFYAVGIVLLATGIMLCTKTGLGISPLIALPYAISQIWSLNFAFLTFLTYSAFVGIQFLLRGRNSRARDLLQLPFCMVFSMLLNELGKLLPFAFSEFWQNLLLLAVAILLTGVGAAMVVGMDIVANPADALAETVGEVMGKGMGFGKNFIDITSVIVTCLVGILATGEMVGVGVGTLCCMICIGRVVWAFNKLLRTSMRRAAGLPV
ncbi:MAG: hypothetical protein PHS97_04810 [Oscillospiraceae bacterium]|nr:hypothetical protein [Oscillospiraceae bacterium]